MRRTAWQAWRVLPFTVGAALALAACRGESRVSAPTIILISIDTLRADHLPAYGYRAVETPAIDALARDAVRFGNAYCQVPLTLPSHAVLLTGLFPYQNGVRDNIGFRLDRKTITLASLLGQNGYATGAAVSSLALRADRGLSSGFDFYDDRFSAESPDERPGMETTAKLTSWMETVSGRPAFAFLHLYEPHAPYAPPEPYRTRYASHPYDGEIATADAAVGRFIAFLKSRGLYDKAAVVFLSDHGEGLGDHGEQEHGVFLYREAIRVPLLVKLPAESRAGQVVSRPVGLIDLFPTLAKLAGVPVPAGLPGRELLSGPAGAARRIYSETLYPRLALGWSDLASLTDDRYEYIEAPRPELYELHADPTERNNLAAAAPPAFRSMRAELAGLQRPEASPRASAEEMQKLGSLGYISVSRGMTGPLPDPKDKVETLARYKRLFDLFYARRDKESIAAAQEILDGDPAIASVWRILATCRERLGDLKGAARDLERGLAVSRTAAAEELSQAYEQFAKVLEKAGDRAGAEKALREAIARGVAEEPARRDLAQILVESGRAGEALALLPASETSPSADAATLDLTGVALAESGRLAEARKSFERALQSDAMNASVLLHLGTLCLRQGDAAGAREWLTKSVASRPDSPATLSALGLAQAQLGDERSALESWRKAVALDPSQFDALFNAAVLAGKMGRGAEAAQGLERFVATAPSGRYAEKIAEARRLLKALRKTPKAS